MHTKTDTALSRNKDTAITLANAVDVVYGRGNHLVIHPGNIYYRSLVDALAEYYAAFPRAKKKLVSELVYESIQAQTPPGRFLAENRFGHYTELAMQKALRKISQCFREKQPMIKAASPSYGELNMNTDELSQKMQEMRSILKGMGCSLDNHGKGIEPAASSSTNAHIESIPCPISVDTCNERTSFSSRNRVNDPIPLWSHAAVPQQYEVDPTHLWSHAAVSPHITQQLGDPLIQLNHTQMSQSSLSINNPLSPRAARSNRRSEVMARRISAQEKPSTLVSTRMSRPHTSTRPFHLEDGVPKSPSSFSHMPVASPITEFHAHGRSQAQHHYGPDVPNPLLTYNMDNTLSSHFPTQQSQLSLDPLFHTNRKRTRFDPNIPDNRLFQSPPSMFSNTNTMQRYYPSSFGMDDTTQHVMVNNEDAVEEEERNLLSRTFSERSVDSFVLSISTAELQNIYNSDPTVDHLLSNDYPVADIIAFEKCEQEDEGSVLDMESLLASSLLTARTEGGPDKQEHDENPINNASNG